MLKQVLPVGLLLVFSFISTCVMGQINPDIKDTFFLAKKKGLIGRIGKIISIEAIGREPIKTANPYIIHNGKIIRYVEIVSLGFERSIYDTNIIKNNFGVRLANSIHKNTTQKVITKNLFFREGSRINAFLLADNERHLRDQVYIQDARIVLVPVAGIDSIIDVVVITKDVFSLGGTLNIISVDRAKIEAKEENVAGSGSKISGSTYYDRSRRPNFGYGMETILRNIKGSFIDWTAGFQTYRKAFNSGRNEETFIYTHIEKPLVTPYIPWIGGIDLSVSKTSNAFISDSLYQMDYRYNSVNADAWFGYNFGSKKILSTSLSDRFRKFIALRGMNLHYNELPERNRFIYDYRYADISGVLASFTAFRQEFFRANFIYGFGRNEDVPEGFSLSIIGGLTNTAHRSRSYFGTEALHTHFKNGYYSSYTFKFGSYVYRKGLEDVDLLLNIDHFTKLTAIGGQWLRRNFYSAGFTKQMRPALNQPLFLRSEFGLPYYNYGAQNADFRGTVKWESVFFNINKFWGFRFAPFLFGDVCVINPINKPFSKSELYSAWGGGIRTGNENLIFGTIELKGYIFPRPINGMKGWKVEVSTNLRFKYNNIFIKKPDFVIPN